MYFLCSVRASEFGFARRVRPSHPATYGQNIQESMYQPSIVANPPRGQLKRKDVFFLVPFAPKILVSQTDSATSSHVSSLNFHVSFLD